MSYIKIFLSRIFQALIQAFDLILLRYYHPNQITIIVFRSVKLFVLRQSQNETSEFYLRDAEQAFDPSDDIDRSGQLQNTADYDRDTDDRQQTAETGGLLLCCAIPGMRVICELSLRLQDRKSVV